MRDAVKRRRNSEACGLLLGQPGLIAQATVAANVAAEPWHRFEIDPAHLFDLHRRARAEAFRILGCWHSHPQGPAVPSVHDREGVSDMGWLWLIVAEEGIRAWRPTPGGFAEVPLAVASDVAGL